MDPWRIFGVEEIFFFGGSPENKLSSLGRLRDCLGRRIDVYFYDGFVDVLGVVLLSN